MIKTKQLSKAERKELRKTSKLHEIIRFVVVGVIATVIDFIVSYVLRFAFANNLGFLTPSGEYLYPVGHYLATAICVAAGFIASVIVNWFLSKGWVFQNVEKGKNFAKARYFWAYVGLSFGGFVLGIGIMVLGEWITETLWGIAYPANPFDENILGNLFNQGGWPFWAYVFIFGIKTLLVLVYNYITRKLLIFKEPKQEILEEKGTPVEEEVQIKIEKPQINKEQSMKKEKKAAEKFNWGKKASKESVKKDLFVALETYKPSRRRDLTDDRLKTIMVEELNRYDTK